MLKRVVNLWLFPYKSLGPPFGAGDLFDFFLAKSGFERAARWCKRTLCNGWSSFCILLMSPTRWNPSQFGMPRVLHTQDACSESRRGGWKKNREKMDKFPVCCGCGRVAAVDFLRLGSNFRIPSWWHYISTWFVGDPTGIFSTLRRYRSPENWMRSHGKRRLWLQMEGPKYVTKYVSSLTVPSCYPKLKPISAINANHIFYTFVQFLGVFFPYILAI